MTAMVIMDEPRAKSIYGGTLAAPVFKRVMERSVRFLATRKELGSERERAPRIRREAGPVVETAIRPASVLH